MAGVNTYSRSAQGDQQLTANFRVKEMACHDGSDLILIDLDLMALVQKVRDWAGAPVTITSGYRSPAYNAQVGGAPNSYHAKGQAADLVVTGKTSTQVAAFLEGVGAKGIMDYQTQAFTHVDTRDVRYWAKVVGGVTSTVSTFGGGSSSGSGSAGGDSWSNVQDATVREIQTRLNSLYGFGLAADGYYGPMTKQGIVRALQTELNTQFDRGLVVDGVWGPHTQSACVVVRQGAEGDITLVLQMALYVNRYIYGGLDGRYTAAVTAEVRQLQMSRGLTPDGEAGPMTFGALLG